MEERGDGGDLCKSYQIRENRKPVERLGVVSIIFFNIYISETHC